MSCALDFPASKATDPTAIGRCQYSVMSGATGIGQACGAAATLAAQLCEGRVREIPAPWIRYELHKHGQFVEGITETPPHA